MGRARSFLPPPAAFCRRRIPRRKVLRTGALMGVVLLASVVGFAGATAGRVWWAARNDDRAHADAIVVLGASQFDGRPSPVFRARLAHAKQLFDDGVART